MGALDKPDDIPQDVWDVAWDLVCNGEAEKVPYYAMSDEITVARKLDTLYIARAIIAAKTEEREACLAEVRAEIAYTRGRMAGCDDSFRMLMSQAWGMCSDTAGVIAERIRKRGEA